MCGQQLTLIRTLVLFSALQETVDKTHYSVDMWLAVTLTVLVWRWRAHVYPESETWKERRAGAPKDPFPVGMVAVVLGVLALVFVGVAGT